MHTLCKPQLLTSRLQHSRPIVCAHGRTVVRRSTRIYALSKVVAFIDSAEGVKLPLEPQQFLGLRGGERQKDSVINQAYDELSNIDCEPGYSQVTVTGRAELLQLVRTDILANKSRPVSEQKSVTVPFDLVPGALALLTQVGYDSYAVSVGDELLTSGRLKSQPELSNDILLSMAVAKCNLARDAFDSGSQVSVGCSLLEEALQLIESTRQPDLAPTLVGEIKSALAELRSKSAVEQVSGPLPTTPEETEERKKLVRSIKDLLKTSSSAAPAANMTPDIMAQLVEQMTCDEVVHVSEWENVARYPQSYKWVFPGLLETIAVGHVVTGFVQCQPTYIKMALRILKYLPGNPDALVSQAVCQVLLGSVQTAIDLLQEAKKLAARNPGDSSNQLSSEAYDFVVKNSPGGEDGLLPGLCLFTELWLSEVAFPSFRDTATHPPPSSLVKYFDDTRVETLINVYDEKSEGLAESVSEAFDGIKRSLVASTAAVAPQLPHLQGSAASPDKSTLIKAAAAVVGAVALFAMFGNKRGDVEDTAALASSSAPVARTTEARATKAAVPVSAAVEAFDARAAEQLVKSWQSCKQACFGTKYDTTDLASVVAEPLLSDTRTKVASFQEQGWYMKYKLHRCKVTEVDTSTMSSRAGGYATVVVTLDETANLYDDEGKQADGYRSSYDARYQVVQLKDGSWRLSKLVVPGEGGSK